ncbi:bifunctional (p)ppGpp synthetase/guanosine-3',5'-bis(diphosphate) 3'-pyrophosphohydrolase, partial [Candidatus Kaiserbacteria bacterium]|nr:bifunctional (p)ppGpp synthetase/guanosine-3',5'-bis(diphosphate) 3'-pyrophosphohydrolase [Candidatus Kaiserbacteria bacterium]
MPTEDNHLSTRQACCMYRPSRPSSLHHYDTPQYPRQRGMCISPYPFLLYSIAMNPAKQRSLKEILDAMASKDQRNTDLVSRAYECAREAHGDQKRYSGDAYFTHPAEVGYMLASAHMGGAVVAAGLLHDTIEDAGIKRDAIKEQFGAEVLALVEGVTKLGNLRYHGAERHTESLRKLFAATAKDIRVLIIKLFDRLHNARTLEHVPVVEKRTRIALETLEIYAPIADRLGMSVLKQDLEDAAFPYAMPKEYEKTRELIKERRRENEKRLEKTEKDLKRELADAGVRNFRAEARVKGVYSLFRKLERKSWDIDKIYDILALRIIFPSMADCYTALGIIHGHWRPVPGKIKDYIANPKPNGYQSIHTTIYTGDGGALEIQLRTEAMHQEALYGIASHLSYKEKQLQNAPGGKRVGLEWIRQFFPILHKEQQGSLKAPRGDTEKIVPDWLHQLAHAEPGSGGSEQYLDTLKSDFFSHRIFVFTPENDAIDMPIAATPIDFAYAVHSELGDTMAGARVNGKMVAIATALKNGDVVEIITKPSAKPSRKWLDIAKTNMAKKHIR